MLDLTVKQLDAVRRILARHVPDREVRAFGSRVTGRAWRYSDLDLVILGAEPLPALTLARLRADFEDSDLPFRVDVIEERDLPAGTRPTLVQLTRQTNAELFAELDRLPPQPRTREEIDRELAEERASWN
jgi:predicted nucleotidyltransferase